MLLIPDKDQDRGEDRAGQTNPLVSEDIQRWLWLIAMVRPITL